MRFYLTPIVQGDERDLHFIGEIYHCRMAIRRVPEVILDIRHHHFLHRVHGHRSPSPVHEKVIIPVVFIHLLGGHRVHPCYIIINYIHYYLLSHIVLLCQFFQVLFPQVDITVGSYNTSPFFGGQLFFAVPVNQGLGFGRYIHSVTPLKQQFSLSLRLDRRN